MRNANGFKTFLAIAVVGAVFSMSREAAAQQSCFNDDDCPNLACGGDVCNWNNGLKCQAAGDPTIMRGKDGWCTTIDDCKCKGEGAVCVYPYCSFTTPPAGGGSGGSSGSSGGSSGSTGGSSGNTGGASASTGGSPASSGGASSTGGSTTGSGGSSSGTGGSASGTGGSASGTGGARQPPPPNDSGGCSIGGAAGAVSGLGTMMGTLLALAGLRISRRRRRRD